MWIVYVILCLNRNTYWAKLYWRNQFNKNLCISVQNHFIYFRKTIWFLCSYLIGSTFPSIFFFIHAVRIGIWFPFRNTVTTHTTLKATITYLVTILHRFSAFHFSHRSFLWTHYIIQRWMLSMLIDMVHTTVAKTQLVILNT